MARVYSPGRMSRSCSRSSNNGGTIVGSVSHPLEEGGGGGSEQVQSRGTPNPRLGLDGADQSRSQPHGAMPPLDRQRAHQRVGPVDLDAHDTDTSLTVGDDDKGIEHGGVQILGRQTGGAQQRRDRVKLREPCWSQLEIGHCGCLAPVCWGPAETPVEARAAKAVPRGGSLSCHAGGVRGLPRGRGESQVVRRAAGMTPMPSRRR